MKTSVKICARCGGDHYDLECNPFIRPVNDNDGMVWTHWATCPRTGEPILLVIRNLHAADGTSIPIGVGH